MIDGDYAYWTGGIHALLAEKTSTRPGYGALWKLETTIMRGFRKTRTTIAYVVIPNISASWKKFGSTGNGTNSFLTSGV